MKITQIVVSVIAPICILAGCATPYHSCGLRGGYSETCLQTNMFRVSFKGNGYVSNEKCHDMALLRCADITLQNGFKFFSIVNTSEDKNIAFYNTPQTASRSGMAMPLGNSYYSTSRTMTHGGFAIPIEKPYVSHIIKCFVEKPDNYEVFDAEFIVKSIKSKYGIR